VGLGRSLSSRSGIGGRSLSSRSGLGWSLSSRSGLGRSLSSRSGIGGRSLSMLPTTSSQSERCKKGAKSELRLHFLITPISKRQVLNKQPS